jgi:hypothetical protein
LPVYLVYPFSPFYPARLRSFIEVMRHAMDELPWHGHVSKVI